MHKLLLALVIVFSAVSYVAGPVPPPAPADDGLSRLLADLGDDDEGDDEDDEEDRA